MSYYDPYYPSIEATRLQIQRSFLALEQKLRMQRQINLDLQDQQRIHRNKLAYQDQLRYREPFLRNPNPYISLYDRQIADRKKYAAQQEASNLKYLSQIQRLQREKLHLSRQRQKAYSFHDRVIPNSRSPYKVISPEQLYQEDETLIKKYEDGTRARQLKYDMVQNKSKYNSANKKIQHQKQGELNRTPFHNLQKDSTQKKFSNQKLSHLNANQFERYQNYNEKQVNDQNMNKNKKYLDEDWISKQKSKGKDIKRKQQSSENYQPHFGSGSFKQPERDHQFRKKQSIQNQNQQTFGFKESNKKLKSKNKTSMPSRERSRSQKQLNLSRGKQKGSSPYSSYLEPKSQRSPYKSTSIEQKRPNALQRSRNLCGFQQSAMQKIQKRLKLSHAIYKDSQFRNSKHQLSHLFNTYDCQNRLRKQLKEKINNHPMVLKKHAMVVQ